MSCDDLIDSINPPSRRAGGVRISPLHIFVTALAVSKLCALGGKKRPHSQDARARLRARSHSTRLRALASGSRAMSPPDETGMASRVSGQRDWTWGAETGSATNSSFYDDEGEEAEEIYRHGVGDAGDVSEASEEEWDEEGGRRRARRLRSWSRPARASSPRPAFSRPLAAPAARVPAPGPAGGIVPTAPSPREKHARPPPARAVTPRGPAPTPAPPSLLPRRVPREGADARRAPRRGRARVAPRELSPPLEIIVRDELATRPKPAPRRRRNASRLRGIFSLRRPRPSRSRIRPDPRAQAPAPRGGASQGGAPHVPPRVVLAPR